MPVKKVFHTCEKIHTHEDTTKPQAQMNLPATFEHEMRLLLGDRYEAFREALLGEPAVSIRLNKAKSDSTPCYEPVPWASDAYYLPERPAFTFDPLFHAGSYYVQEASSMFVEQAVRQHLSEARAALDLCAAPGGKSTLLRSLLPDDCVLVSNEVMRPRAQVLTENIIKWGHPRSIVTSNYPADFTPLGPLFDLILVDAPCSGEGMFRKDEVAVSEWSPENVNICWQRQRDILTDIWPTLRPGGLLIYSTCTFNTHEDEENVRWITTELDAELLQIAIDDSWGITPSLLPEVAHAYRFLPGRTRGEGFFLAALRKRNSAPEVTQQTEANAKRNKKNKDKHSAPPTPAECKQWIDNNRGYIYKNTETEVVAIPTDMEPIQKKLTEHLCLLKSGITIATRKGRDLLPTHELAMSNVLNTEAFTRCELTYTEALNYLHREAITLPPDTPRGFIIVTYRNTPLGFVKNLGNRANNLYPNEWRIRSGHFPDKQVSVL